jgi:hypothetical protein
MPKQEEAGEKKNVKTGNSRLELILYTLCTREQNFVTVQASPIHQGSAQIPHKPKHEMRTQKFPISHIHSC